MGRRDACGLVGQEARGPQRAAEVGTLLLEGRGQATVEDERAAEVEHGPILADRGREVPARLGAPVPGFGTAGTASLAVVHTRAGSHRARPARRGRQRRARTVRGALGVTLLGAVLPGAGWLWSGRLIGYVLLVPVVGGSVYALATLRDVDALVDLATDPARLRAFAVVLGIGLTVWAVSVLTTYVWVRPVRAARLAVGRRAPSSWRSPCVAAALPVVQTMRYTAVQADLVETLFTENRTATAPRGISEAGPVGRPRAREHPAPRR